MLRLRQKLLNVVGLSKRIRGDEAFAALYGGDRIAGVLKQAAGSVGALGAERQDPGCPSGGIISIALIVGTQPASARRDAAKAQGVISDGDHV